MNENYIKLYAATDTADSVYFLSEGSVYFYISNADKYAITGKNLIIGSTEIIMNKVLGAETARIETAVADGRSEVKRILVEKFIAGMEIFSFALNTSMVLAKQVMLTGQILQKNMSDLEGDEKKTREYSIEYYAIIQRLKAEYDKRRLPWLKEIVEEFGDTLTYKKGEAYGKSAEHSRMHAEAALTDKDVEYQRGDVIFKEDTPGSEMFILKNGSVDVHVKGSRITTIDEPGTVIGESSLLLSEPRHATLTAKNNVIMTRIRKEDLKEVAEKQKNFLPGIAATLARRHYSNVSRIETVNKSLVEHIIDREISGEDKKAALSKRAHHELAILIDRVEEAVRDKKADFLSDLTEKL
jgi:CRP-like cAMP-binding protein